MFIPIVLGLVKGLTQQKYNELSAKFNEMKMGEAKTEALRRAIFRKAIKMKLDQGRAEATSLSA